MAIDMSHYAVEPSLPAGPHRFVDGVCGLCGLPVQDPMPLCNEFNAALYRRVLSGELIQVSIDANAEFLTAVG